MLPFGTPLHDIEGCEIVYKKAPHLLADIIAELYEGGTFRFSIRVNERYDGKDLTHEQVVQKLEEKLLKNRLEDLEFLNDV